jgi:PAS domain S-box-containing protein
MSIKKEKSKLGGQSRFIILMFVLIAALLISSAVIELRQSKKELYQLMTKQAHSLLESLIITSQNTLRATAYLDEISEQRLLNNAGLIKRMYENKRVTNQILNEISRQNNIYRINIFNENGQKIFSSYQQEHVDIPEKHNPRQILQSIFTGEEDTLIIGYKEARFESGYRFAIALAAKDRSAIVLNIDAKEMLKFKRDIDFGALIRKVVRGNPQIVYIALQDTENILAASGNVIELDGIEQSEFLTKSFRDSSFATRTAQFESGEIFEAVHPFAYTGETIGLFRLGLSLEPIQDINERIYRRLIIITLILISIGFILFVYIFTSQRLNILQKQYEVVETYSGSIIYNVSDAIIVLDKMNGIKIFNTAAEKLFLKNKNEIIGKELAALFTDQDCQLLLQEETLLKQMNCKSGNRHRDLLISKSSFSDRDENENTILVIRDLTEQKQMEAQLERQQRLTAMGELASGVAHEIRNPLNTIGTIIQQLDRDFEPVSEKDEYHELAGLVYNEVKRINETVQDFLRFSRPEPVQPSLFHISKIFNELDKQYKSVMETKKIKLDIRLDWQGAVFWDNRQMKQALINIIQNAVEAIGENGNISIVVKPVTEQDLEIQIKDDGPGMPENIRSNIFNLYFTTKARGTGIGLSIVQRIIYEHGGMINVESEQGHGSAFIIKMPVRDV